MQGAERVQKRSCQFCMSEQRDELENQIMSGHITAKEIDKTT